MFGRLNKINLLLNKEDYVTVLKVLEQNVDEKLVQAVKSAVKSEYSRGE